MAVRPLRELKWWHKELARDIVLGGPKATDEYLLKRWVKFGLTKNKLRKYRKDPLMIDEMDNLRKIADEKLADYRAEARFMLGDALTAIKEILDPTNFDITHEFRGKIAMKLISEMQLGRGEADETGKIHITITDTREDKSDDGAEVKIKL
jgi:hypothetical protein